MQSSAQIAPTPDVDARRLPPGEASALRVDGLLDEPAWRDAPIASGFRQQEPFEGEPATEITEVRVLYDDATLYIGILARDSSPDQVIARILQRDKLMETGFENIPAFTGDDAIAIVLDPFHDHRNAVVLATNPNGAEFDALITDEGREFNIDWRGVWEVAASIEAAVSDGITRTGSPAPVAATAAARREDGFSMRSRPTRSMSWKSEAPIGSSTRPKAVIPRRRPFSSAISWR